MMVVAKKKSGLLLLYGIILLFGLVIIVAAFTKEFETHYLIAILFAIVIIALFSYNIVKYLRVPNEIITVDNKGMLHLPKDVTLDPKDIIDVSYRCARGKGITYHWGEITIITHLESFKFDYVDDCEDVSKELTRMMYESKQSK